MKNIINNKIILVGLLALAMVLPGSFVAAQSAVPSVSYPSPAATSITADSATLNANVNPNGSSTNIWFEIQGVGGPFGSQNIGSGTSNVAVTYNATGSQPGTLYSFRVVAVNANGSTNGSYQSFSTTSVNAPSISSPQAGSITTNSAVLSASVNPNGSSTNIWFEASNSSGPLAPQNIGSGSSNVAVSYTLSNLAANTEYSFRIEAVNIIGSASTGAIFFKTLAASTPTTSAPSITTSSASSIDEDSATLNASYNANGASTYVRFAYGTSYSNLNSFTSYQSVGTGSGSNAQSISGLAEDTTYYFRAEAYNGIGGSSSSSPVQGSILNFTTDDDSPSQDEPDIATDSADSITSSSAYLNATFDANGDGTYIRFAYGTSSSSLTSYTDYEYVGSGSGSFSEKISGLSANTTYYFRAQGYNDGGSDDGSIYSFTTLPADSTYSGQYPIATTKFTTNVASTSVTLNGEAKNSYGLSTSAWFEYGTTLSLANSTSKQSLGSGSSLTFKANVSGLSLDTIYYFRAVAENSGGQSKGEILVFKTGKSGTVSSVPVSSSPTSTIASPAIVATVAGKALSLEIETKNSEAAPGQIVEYFINYKNNSDKEIKDIAINVTLPREIKFLKSSDGDFSSSDNSLSVKIVSLKAGEGRVLYVQGQVDENALTRENAIVAVTASYVNPTTKEKEDVLGYVVGDIVSRGNQLAAAAIFGEGGILPNTIAEWIILIIVIGALVFLGRKIYVDLERKKVAKGNGPVPSNLPR